MKLTLLEKKKFEIEVLILLAILLLPLVSIVMVPNSISQANEQDEIPQSSAPAIPKYKYLYENDFDYLSTYQNTPNAYSEVTFLDGDDSEWSQNSDDTEKLQLYYTCVFDPLDWSFIMDGGMVVISHNTFETQSDPDLGAFIKWKIDIDNPYLDKLSYDFILVSLLILTPNNYEELITIESFDPQADTFYLANFDQYIWSDGRIRFLVRGLVYGSTNQWSGISIKITCEGLEVVQEIKPVSSDEEARTLILVHGFGCETPISFWGTYRASLEFKETYDKIIIMSYYGDYCAYKYSKDEFGDWEDPITYSLGLPETSVMTSINDIAAGLAYYITQDLYYIGDNIDIVCHSMGGLVTRFMIKNYYPTIQAIYQNVGRSFTIHSVCTIGTPNHGVWYGWLVPTTQTLEMAPGSPFITALNYVDVYPGTEIPLSGININWFTYRSGIYKEFGVRNDGVVEMSSVPIIGATNKGIYDLNHGDLISSKMMNHVVFNDLFTHPEIIETIFNEAIPGKIVKIEDMTLEGQTLSITFPSDIALDIDPTTVVIEINPTYQMTLKDGTTDTYEVDLLLEVGEYPFLITANDLEGRLYQISGILNVLPVDITPPVITIISPMDGLMTNGDVMLEYTVEDDYTTFSEISISGPDSGTTYSYEGFYDITITATDEAGNSATTSVSFTIDKTVPLILFNLPSDGYYNTEQIVEWNVIEEHPDTTISTHQSGTLFDVEGTYTVTVEATDQAGNFASKSLTLVLDKTAPIITITGPTEGYYNTDQMVVWTVSDEYFFDEIANYPSPTTFTEDGTYQVTVSAIDLAGNTATASSAEFIIDKTPPVITINGPTAGYYKTPQTVTWTVIEANIAQILYNYGPETTFENEGTYQVTITAIDLAGNQVTASSAEFTIDTTPPVITITGPAEGCYNTPQTVIWSVDELNLDQVLTDYDPVTVFETDGTYQVIVKATDLAGNTATASSAEFTIDLTNPITSVSFGDPHFKINDVIHLTNTTSIVLIASEIPGGSGIAKTYYKISDYNSEWQKYDGSFTLELIDGAYNLEYYSIDKAGNQETPKLIAFYFDSTPPSLDWEDNGKALQDGYRFTIEADDSTGVAELKVLLRELNSPVVTNIPVSYIGGNFWQADTIFETTNLPDGYYELIVQAIDEFGYVTLQEFPFSIRNWAVLELLPSTESNKAGRTMPIKFALRVVEEVDPAKPFVINQELDIFVTDLATDQVLQHSTYGDSSTDYRINILSELYITNFKTHKTPTTYLVSIYRHEFFIGDFDFFTE